ncbi:MAG TPA: Flp pilus assembly protein CpaB [Polyangiaceae bacterium]|nr:Flp pilus assembly protein CpaB [Polyangiaceae bacterium]
MKQRSLSIAALLALAATVLLVLYMRRFEQEMSGGEPVEILMAIKPIERGTVLTDDMLANRAVPIAYVEDRAIKAAERSKIIGLQAANSLQPQQTLMWMDLAITTEERDLSSLVQPGKRAFTVRATTGEDTRGNALIRPGDYVDVIVTMRSEQESGQQTSVVLLQRILVLAVGFDTQSKAGAGKARESFGGNNEKVLTLSLNLQESQLLALALEKGRLSVAVRNVKDQRVVNNIPDMKAQALSDTAARSAVQQPQNRAALNYPVKIGEPEER